jgi:hypothetical protein
MGAIFAVPVARVHDPAELPGERIALAARMGAPLRGPLETEATIVVGAERAGLPADVLAACDRTCHIPIAGESLNAAMAATIALYEATRKAGPRPAATASDSTSVAPRESGPPPAATASDSTSVAPREPGTPPTRSAPDSIKVRRA